MPEQFPLLTRPPITEALLDIRAVLPDGSQASALTAAFAPAVLEAYPEKRPIRHMQAQFALRESGGELSSEEQHVGEIFWTTDHTRAVQARIDGFTVNHVSGYKDWQAIVSDARRYWTHYVAAAKPTKVIRCAVRYINRVQIPVAQELEQHLKTYPAIGSGLPALLDEYTFRCVLSFGEQRRAAITQAALAEVETSNRNTRGLLLDIDAFSEREFQPESDQLWEEFESLRTIKNQCFFNSLQPRTWQAYV